MSQNYRPLCALFLIVGLACQQSPAPPAAASTDPSTIGLELRPGTPTRITEEPWMITFDSVTDDSRCARSVECTWEGSASARFDLERYPPGDTSPSGFDLQLGRWAELAGMRIQFKELHPTPNPGSRIPAASYRAVVEVRPIMRGVR